MSNKENNLSLIRKYHKVLREFSCFGETILLTEIDGHFFAIKIGVTREISSQIYNFAYDSELRFNQYIYEKIRENVPCL